MKTKLAGMIRLATSARCSLMRRRRVLKSANSQRNALLLRRSANFTNYAGDVERQVRSEQVTK